MRLRIYEICGTRIRSSATDPRRMHSVGDSEISMNGQIRENAAPSDRGAPSGNTRVMRSFWMIGKVPSGLWSVLLFVTGGASSLALIIFATRHIGSIGFWFDESVQFWMSLGEDPFAQPFSRRGRLADAIHFNGINNLDPGGFTVLLRWWMHAGTDPFWQRTLPLLFFCAGAAALALIGRRNYRSFPFALLCCLVPALFPMLLDYSMEVRAYSMEFAGVVIGCALVDRIALRPVRDPFLLAAGAIFGFFLSSRYAYTLFTAAAMFALIASCHMRRVIGAPTTRLADLVAMAVPVMAVASLIAVYALWPQYRARISYQGGALLEYFASSTAASKSLMGMLGMLGSNLLGPAGLPVTVAALAGSLVLLRKKVWMGISLRRAGESMLSGDFVPFGLLCLAALVLSGLAWRWHPWDMSTKWSLWLQALSAVAVVRISAAVLARMPARATEAGGLISLALLLIAALLALRLATYHRSAWPSLLPELQRLESLQPRSESVAIDQLDYPTVRYFYEYGPLVGSHIYPGAFRYSYRRGPKQLIDANTRFLVSGRTIEGASRNFAPARIVADPDLPPHLFRVEPTSQSE
jgi:hypothetical protein